VPQNWLVGKALWAGACRIN